MKLLKRSSILAFAFAGLGLASAADAQEARSVTVSTVNHRGLPLAEPVFVYLTGTGNEVLKLETNKNGLLVIKNHSCDQIHEIEVQPRIYMRVTPGTRQACMEPRTVFKIKTP